MTDNVSASGMIMADTKIVRRPDGSFVLDDIYHVPDNEEYAMLFAELSTLAEEQPERIVDLPAPSPEEALEEARAAKLAELANSFAWAQKNATVMCGSGFVIDANERARLDIEGLLATLEGEGQTTVSFCGADNPSMRSAWMI